MAEAISARFSSCSSLAMHFWTWMFVFVCLFLYLCVFVFMQTLVQCNATKWRAQFQHAFPHAQSLTRPIYGSDKQIWYTLKSPEKCRVMKFVCAETFRQSLVYGRIFMHCTFTFFKYEFVRARVAKCQIFYMVQIFQTKFYPKKSA